ncbi:MAG: hypothetical protein WBG41_14735 [Acidimicrobiales bacterium]
MPFVNWINHHRLLVSGVSFAVLLVLAVAGGIWFFLLRTTGTQIDLRQALRLYRQDQHGSSPRTEGGLPAPGVYVYRTTGGEKLSLAGISRTFPSASHMIVTDSKCSSMDWVPLEQHIEGIQLCREPDGALTMSQASSVESIAGVSTTQVTHCPSTDYFIPPRPHAGQRWSAVCHGPGQVDKISGEVIGTTTLTVNGRTVSALHTRINTAVSGNATGTDPTDYWVSPQTGLIYRQREEVSVSQSIGPLGAVHYNEEMAISMSSLLPVQ